MTNGKRRERRGKKGKKEKKKGKEKRKNKRQEKYKHNPNLVFCIFQGFTPCSKPWNIVQNLGISPSQLI